MLTLYVHKNLYNEANVSCALLVKVTLPPLQASPPCWWRAAPRSHSAGSSQRPGSYGESIRGMNRWCSGSAISHNQGEVNAEIWICFIITRTLIRCSVEQRVIGSKINMEINNWIRLANKVDSCCDSGIQIFYFSHLSKYCHAVKYWIEALAVLAVVNFLIERINMVTYCSALTVETCFVQRGLGVTLSQIKPSKAKLACQVASHLSVYLWAHLQNKTLTWTNFNKPLFLFRSWSGWSVWAFATAVPSPASSHTCRLRYHCRAK